ncbi:MAG: hypothetical protein IPH41_01990 [Sulfuritalea sp.]|jgi:hypothetical protein|nr:hypothetical protein [Sulfuritalea sp.]
MSVQMERRIRKLEEAAANRQPAKRQVKIMGFPVGGDADDEASFRAEVEQAVRDGFFVIKLMPLQPAPWVTARAKVEREKLQ